jgi:hypothetical protein
LRSGSGITAFPIRSSTGSAVNKGTNERLMDSRFGLQLLSAFEDETLEMPQQLDLGEGRLGSGLTVRQCKRATLRRTDAGRGGPRFGRRPRLPRARAA